MRRSTNRRIRMAAIAAAAVTVSVVSVPVSASAAGVIATRDPGSQSGAAAVAVREGKEEVLTVAEDVELAAAGYGKPVSRDTVMTRAKDWFNRNVPYDDTSSAWDVNEGKRYRQDCSGFVSMAWKLRTSKTTRTLDQVSHVINWNDLLRGDALVHYDDHAVLFDKWVDADTKADFWVYEESNPTNDMNHRKINVRDIRNDGFKPYRYDGIRK
ncbi:hypothetical protein Aab01nite_38640 [Paractinoplanes abujensis]|uniref:Uncharacterized protein n=1 Tax=Paractinoplanes abujensis TaxID=882441 RepID=A0A7W7CTQ3_9ACTN|nr:hypothetical protein [Actinoplanes abujensis]MBB4694513.1 hypothetical protein [Actinoplanes abujensis]GID20274.1 hypothetical protein Aab01nite_38640 [Actinoplanes abujensis]